MEGFTTEDFTKVKVVKGKLKGVEGYVLTHDFLLAMPMIAVFGTDGNDYIVQYKNIKINETED